MTDHEVTHLEDLENLLILSCTVQGGIHPHHCRHYQLFHHDQTYNTCLDSHAGTQGDGVGGVGIEFLSRKERVRQFISWHRASDVVIAALGVTPL